MQRVLSSVLLLLLVLLSLAPTFAAEPATFSATVQQQQEATQPAAPAVTQPQARQERLGLLERRRLGLTIANVARITSNLRDEGLIDRGTPRSVTAALVMARLQAESPEVWAPYHAEAQSLKAAGDQDWDAFFQAIIQFLEALMPLIEMLIILFAWNTPQTILSVAAIGVVFFKWPWGWRRCTAHFAY